MDTSGSPPPFQAELAGAQFRPKEAKVALDLAASVARGQNETVALELKRDYVNPYDMFAVEVHFGPHFVGFIEKKVSMYLGQWLDLGHAYRCELVQADETGKRRHLLLCTPTGKRIPTKAENEAAQEAEYQRLRESRTPANTTGNLPFDDDIPF